VPVERRQLLEEMFLDVVRSTNVKKQLATEGVSGAQDAAAFKQALGREWRDTPSILERLKITSAR
jgi:hypothetical protein